MKKSHLIYQDLFLCTSSSSVLFNEHYRPQKTLHFLRIRFLLLNILPSERRPCYSRGMKAYTTFHCSNCQNATKEPGPFRTHKVVIVLFLIAAGFFPCWESQPEKGAGRAFECIPAVYGAERPEQLKSSAKQYRGVINPSSATIRRQMKETLSQKTSLMQQTRMVNSSTCGRPWKHPLVNIQGKVRNVAYRVQPLTGRRGLHIDVETDQQTDTVIHIYPERLTAKCPSVFYFRVGDRVTVTGSEFFTGRGGIQQNVCAATITQGEKVLGVRDPQTGSLERQLCCQEICEKNCTGLPPCAT